MSLLAAHLRLVLFAALDVSSMSIVCDALAIQRQTTAVERRAEFSTSAVRIDHDQELIRRFLNSNASASIHRRHFQQGPPRLLGETPAPKAKGLQTWMVVVIVVGVLIIIAGIAVCCFWRWWVKHSARKGLQGQGYAYATLGASGMTMAPSVVTEATTNAEAATELATEAGDEEKAEDEEEPSAKPKSKRKGKAKPKAKPKVLKKKAAPKTKKSAAKSKSKSKTK